MTCPPETNRVWILKGRCDGFRYLSFICSSLNTSVGVRHPGRFLGVPFKRWFYLELQSECDHQTSEESIENGITANVYTYTETEQRFGRHMGGLNPPLAEYLECMYILYKWRP